MTPERYQQIGRLFDEALERPHAERAAFLAQASSGDAALRAEVEKLLANLPTSKEFLSRTALDVAAELYAQDQPAEISAVGTRISRYEILSLLGAGGMGQVYLAKDTRLGRQVALKLLPAHFMQNTEHLRRFEREALAASALNHPNILTVYEFGVEGETHFLATEFVQGENLRQRIEQGELTVAQILDITVQIVSALQAAHQAHIIHRDIKPENVMLRNDGIVKVLDFGLAKLVAPDAETAAYQPQSLLTQRGVIMGTVAYMSPEQARGRALDARSDLFSLGVMLYEMLAGRRPFAGETVNHLIVAILEQEPPPLAPAGQTFPAELERIVKQLLAKKVEARYASAAALLTDLKKLAKRLELDEELQYAAPAARGSEASTQILRVKTKEHLAATTGPQAASSPEKNPETAANPSSVQTATDIVRTPAPKPVRRKPVWLLGAALLAAVVIGAIVWQGRRLRAIKPPAQPAAALPERHLSYSLTVQKYRNGKPYHAEFQSSGREIFEPGWRFKLNLSSPQEGFLYLLNEEPTAAGSDYVLLFPLPSQHNGSAHLVADERLQTGWYVFDDQPGTEHFRLIWAAQPVPELEAAREFVNAKTQGRISAPTQAQAVRALLQQHANSPLESVLDRQNKQTNVRGRGATLVALIELEHH